MVGSNQPCRSQETSTRTSKSTVREDDPPREESTRDEVEGEASAPVCREMPKSRPEAKPDDKAVDSQSIPRARWLPPARR